MSAQGHLARQGGYTLFEMLVALSLTGFLSTALLANIGLGARVWETVEDRSHQSAASNALDKVLRRHIALAVPLSVTADASSRMVGGQVYFEGDSQRLRFFTEAGAGALPPGIYGVEFDISGNAGQRKNSVMTVRRARAAVGGLGGNENVIWDESRLPLGNGDAVFEYYGSRPGNGDAGWQQDWSGRRALPELVRLLVGSGQSAEIVVIAPALDYSAATMPAGKLAQYFADIRG